MVLRRSKVYLGQPRQSKSRACKLGVNEKIETQQIDTDQRIPMVYKMRAVSRDEEFNPPLKVNLRRNVYVMFAKLNKSRRHAGVLR